MDTPIRLSQLDFTRSGYYRDGNGILYTQSLEGRYRLRQGSSIKNAYDLYFSSTFFHMRNDTVRGHGMTLRCLAR